METRLCILGGFSQSEEGDGAEHNRASSNTQAFGFVELFDSLVEIELEVGLV